MRAEVYCSCWSVRDGVCISGVAGGRWSKAGDEWEEQESGGARLGQAMGNSIASHLLEGQHTHSHLHTCNQIQCFLCNTNMHTHSVTNTYANQHEQVLKLVLTRSLSHTHAHTDLVSTAPFI